MGIAWNDDKKLIWCRRCVCVGAAELRVVSESFRSHLRLQSALSRTYLCFNRRGRLTVRVSTDHYNICMSRILRDLCDNLGCKPKVNHLHVWVLLSSSVKTIVITQKTGVNKSYLMLTQMSQGKGNTPAANFRWISGLPVLIWTVITIALTLTLALTRFWLSRFWLSRYRPDTEFLVALREV